MIILGQTHLPIAGTSLITVEKENSVFRNYKSDLTITLDNGNIITRSSERIWTWATGLETTEDQTDDVINIDGAVTASNSNGDMFPIRWEKPRNIFRFTRVMNINLHRTIKGMN